MNRRRIKNKKFHINKIEKRMRELQRKNKRRKIRIIRYRQENYSEDVYNLLLSKGFGNISFGDRIFVKNSTGAVPIEIPEVFSITKNYEETIKLLRKVFYYGSNENIKMIIFYHNKCRELGIAASTIMDTIVLACSSHRKNSGNDLVISGNFPENKKVKKIFIASGLPAHLKLRDKIHYRKDNIKLFSLIAGKGGTGRSGTVATKLTDYINECLNTQDFSLTPVGKRRISRMFSEVIDNCELHGGKNTTWYSLGHFDMTNNNYGEMHLVIFNYGVSIYEQLISEETTAETREKIDFMREVHKSQYDTNWKEETMLTVFSLQQGISRLRDKESTGNKKRGTGTIVLLETFYNLGKTIQELEPEFSIVSGHTHILFDKKYELQNYFFQDNVLGNGERKIIAFNEENNIFKKADKDNVRFMKQYFPGTIISMKFYIDREYLENLGGNKNGEN